jgi:hypothetical protein
MPNRPETFVDNSYYSNQTNFIEFKAGLDWEIWKFLANLLFDGDMERIKYASNAYAFRSRSDDQGGNITLPFVNFRTSSNGLSFSNDQNWYNAVLRSNGLWIPEINSSLRLMPVTLEYEATFWCSMEHELQVAAQRLIFNKYDNVGIPFDMTVQGKDIKFPARIINEDRSISWDSDYNEEDWLEQNQIRNISFDFEVMTFMPEFPTDLTFSVTQKAILEFAATQADMDNVTEDQFIEFFVEVE